LLTDKQTDKQQKPAKNNLLGGGNNDNHLQASWKGSYSPPNMTTDLP